MKGLIGGCVLVALLLWPLASTAQTRAQVVEAIEAGETVPISEEGALEMPTDVDDADDIRDDNNPEDVGQEALGGEEEDAP